MVAGKYLPKIVVLILDSSFPSFLALDGNMYNTAAVSTNGCIQLNGLGLEGCCFNYEDWSYMNVFLSDSDPDNPWICPFDVDLDICDNGEIYYNNSRNPLVITWDGVGAHDNTDALATFQILLYESGRIVLNFNGILVGDNLIDDLNGGIVVGVTPSDFPFDGEDFVPGDPGPVDLNQGPFDFGPTAYERWCFEVANSCDVDGSDTGLPGPINTAFDLDFWSICFEPIEDGFSVTSGFEGEIGFMCEPLPEPIPTLSEWGLIAMAAILGIVGFMVLRRRKVTA